MVNDLGQLIVLLKPWGFYNSFSVQSCTSVVVVGKEERLKNTLNYFMGNPMTSQSPNYFCPFSLQLTIIMPFVLSSHCKGDKYHGCDGIWSTIMLCLKWPHHSLSLLNFPPSKTFIKIILC